MAVWKAGGSRGVSGLLKGGEDGGGVVMMPDAEEGASIYKPETDRGHLELTTASMNGTECGTTHAPLSFQSPVTASAGFVIASVLQAPR